MNNSFLKSLVCLLFVLSSSFVFAQDVNRRINEIKLNNNYFFAESTMPTEPEATNTAVLMLVNFVNDYINSNNLSKDLKETEQSILSKVEFVKGARGSYSRVLAYVSKHHYVPGFTAPAPEQSAQAPAAAEPVLVSAPEQASAPASNPSIDLNRRINDIKRDQQYFSSESTMPTELEATNTAVLMLVNFVNDYINSNNLSKDLKETEQSILGKVKFIKGARGSYSRVLAYVSKHHYVSGYKEPNVVSTPEPEPEAVPAPTPEPEVAAPQPQPQVQAQPAIKIEDCFEKEWQLEVVRDLLAQPNLESIMKRIEMHKMSYKIQDYGLYNKCNDRSTVYWVVFNNDLDRTLAAIIAPSNARLINFVTMQPDSLTNYLGKSYSAIWFRMAD